MWDARYPQPWTLWTTNNWWRYYQPRFLHCEKVKTNTNWLNSGQVFLGLILYFSLCNLFSQPKRKILYCNINLFYISPFHQQCLSTLLVVISFFNIHQALLRSISAGMVFDWVSLFLAYCVSSNYWRSRCMCTQHLHVNK